MEDYQTAQRQFIKEKTAALKVIERKLELDTSLQDHKQVRIKINHSSKNITINYHIGNVQ